MDPLKNRIKKEYQDIINNKESTVRVKLVDEKLNHWKGTIEGSSDTPYQGGKFIVDIVIPEDYPFKPPKMKFDTKIWHPNVSSVTGAICLDILKNEWTPALSIRTALISLQALMCEPIPDDPQDGQVAAMYKSDINLFNKTAKEWTETYANEDKIYKEKVKNLMDMGFNEDQATKALESNDQDFDKALNYLLG